MPTTCAVYQTLPWIAEKNRTLPKANMATSQRSSRSERFESPAPASRRSTSSVSGRISAAHSSVGITSFAPRPEISALGIISTAGTGGNDT
jgi:hypothetical protein